MNTTRRSFLKSAALGAAGAPLLLESCNSQTEQAGFAPVASYSSLDDAISSPVLKKELFPDPVIIDRLELLRYEDNFICRITSTDGAEGLSVANNEQMASL